MVERQAIVGSRVAALGTAAGSLAGAISTSDWSTGRVEMVQAAASGDCGTPIGAPAPRWSSEVGRATCRQDHRRSGIDHARER
ncbi:hypothetical protein G5V58_11895 [Nocardioides anomalus]|uniref:Uncharacterized protein n=1 Tax=Nocardioides anomalus TaxID=2712223 RepID=A0A6G6WDR8_9ACTN|nr:hypothetical protein [Nocardioides anomalus]QIG43374.1 hypothetical protein G5V58_11895 [Nocardioides anomalus]